MRRRLGTIAICMALAVAMTGCSASTTAEVSDAAKATSAPEPSTPEPSTPESQSPEPSAPGSAAPVPQPASPTGSAIVLVDSGAEPRISLQTAAATSTVRVTATEDSDTTFGSASEQQSFSGDYDLTLTTSSDPNGFTLVIDRTVRTLDTDGPAPDVDAIVGFRQNYTSAGLPVFVINPQEDAYRRLSGGLLSTPHLLLAAPAEPVGVGATWTIPVDQTGDLVAEVTLLAINDSTVEIDLNFVHTTDEGSFTMTADGTYDRTSLLAHNVTTVSTLTLDAEVSENGQLVPARTEQESVRIYQEVSA